MAISFTTALRNYIAVTGSLRAALQLGKVKVYSGAIPANADAANAGTLLWTLTKDGDGSTGLSFNAGATDGMIEKLTGEVWQGVVSNPGAAAATFWRMENAATAVMLQGLVGTAGSDMNLTSVTPADGVTVTLDVFRLRLP